MRIRFASLSRADAGLASKAVRVGPGIAGRRVLALATSSFVACAGAADNPAEIFELPSVQVVGTAPLPGLGTPLRDVPANVQLFDNRSFANTRPLTLTQFLDLNANSVNAASGQGNAFQQSLDFRGFTASPLLGTPQGLSVFQDGVRINEAFGDVVNWDLLPRSAISSMQLVPGSVPAYGLNTLGGALAIYTKSGAQYPGAVVEASGGSFGRRTLEFEYGRASQAVDAFATARFSDDDGWAQHNPSRVRQFFGKLGFQDERTDLDISVTLADNTLQGAQTLPLSFLDRPRESYTFPDVNQNRLAFVVARGSRLIGDAQLIDANLYYRRFRNANLSSNVNDDYGTPDGSGNVQTNPATNDVATSDATSFGGAVQWTVRARLAGHTHQFAVGGGANMGLTHFGQSSQPATFDALRGTIATGAYAQTTRVALRNVEAGIYASDTINLSDTWTLSASARYNLARAGIEDRSGVDSSLDGSHRFSRVNPAIGVNFNPVPALTAYASYSEGMRAPTPIELTCADPGAPCKLPNQFLADPPLAKVVASTIEAGARGRIGIVTWSAATYRSELRDDLAFIASGTGSANAGYFQNVGRTRREGIELATTVRMDPVTLALRYNAIDARFRSTFEAASPNNSEADANGAIVVRPGNRIPGVPVHSAKLRIDWNAAPGLEIGASIAATSSQYPRGDENNADSGGRVPGYAVVHLDVHYRMSPRVTLFAQVENLFDRRYSNFALLGSNVFTGPDRTFGPAAGIAPIAEQFRALGAPRGVWAGVRVAFDAPPAGS
jgi:outer membrane receptor protein involved in Fe transport